jgi:pyruvate-ferredoxin/flavodoxin oxidoreductase
MGMRLTVDKFSVYAMELLEKVTAAGCVEASLTDALKAGVAGQKSQGEIEKQRELVVKLKEQCTKSDCDECKRLLTVADYLVKKSVWIVGGDGWAYDIGYGGLDHVLASGTNVNVLVMDTEVYSNTGGQMSKATPRGAIAKFAAAGKTMPKKNLGLILMNYGGIYIAQIALAANPNQAVKAYAEAESYDGPSLVIAYTHCIAHGFNLMYGVDEQRKAIECGHWPLYRFDPRLKAEGKNPLQLDSKEPTLDFEEYAYGENRYRALKNAKPEVAAKLMAEAKKDAASRYTLLEKLSQM